jgi:hypothetical protein
MLNPAQPSQDKILALSSEIALACDADGIVLWADARAVRLLGARPPVPFVSRRSVARPTRGSWYW